MAPRVRPLPEAAVRSRRDGARALERLRHRPVAAGRPQGRRGGVPEGHPDGPGLRRRVGERGAGADPGGQHRRAPRRCCARRSIIDARPGQDAFLPRDGPQAHGNYDEALEHLREAARQYPRDRVVRNQLGRVLFLERQYREARRRVPARAGRRSRRPPGALQPDARVPGAGRRGRGRARAHAVRALQGGRVGTGDHRCLPAAAPARQQRAAGDPRARRGDRRTRLAGTRSSHQSSAAGRRSRARKPPSGTGVRVGRRRWVHASGLHGGHAADAVVPAQHCVWRWPHRRGLHWRGPRRCSATRGGRTACCRLPSRRTPRCSSPT